MRRLWDVLCRVIDNYGDVGVCWRLSADLAARGQRVRLWIDDPSALPAMAPGALEGRWPGVQVLDAGLLEQPTALASLPLADIVVEGFGCEPPDAYLAWRFGGRAPHDGPPDWINLEYLSAEAYVRRSHGLPSPVLQGPARGHRRHFFFPGFDAHTGGLLREPGLIARREAFDRTAWLERRGVDPSEAARRIALFCYEPPALADWLARWQADERPTELLVTVGRSARAVAQALGLSDTPRADPATGAATVVRAGALRCHFLPWLTQPGFDELLWACDLNCVRGEDSLVRAIWAGRPFVWQIYPQADEAHRAKLQAFLDTLDAPPSWRQAHAAWNGDPVPWPDGSAQAWQACVQVARARLEAQDDLVTRLLAFTGSAMAGAAGP